jgi:hypothetical protein
MLPFLSSSVANRSGQFLRYNLNLLIELAAIVPASSPTPSRRPVTAPPASCSGPCLWAEARIPENLNARIVKNARGPEGVCW